MNYEQCLKQKTIYMNTNEQDGVKSFWFWVKMMVKHKKRTIRIDQLKFNLQFKSNSLNILELKNRIL